jgi:hypothetical protein
VKGLTARLYQHERAARLRKWQSPATARCAVVNVSCSLRLLATGSSVRMKNVRSEMALKVLAYNVKRMVALLSARGLKLAMQG